jgi:hypothetical protein
VRHRKGGGFEFLVGSGELIDSNGRKERDTGEKGRVAGKRSERGIYARRNDEMSMSRGEV